MRVRAMDLVVETFLLVEKCKRDLVRLKELSGDFGTASELSRKVLTGALKEELAENAADRPPCGSRFKLDPGEWRKIAGRTRVFAETVIEPCAKRHLLEIAESYDRMAE